MSNTGSPIQLTASFEQGLWKQFQQGDENALSSLYSIYFDHLYNYGFKFSQDATLVEDCIQELFIKLIRNRQNLAVPDSVKNYLFKALRSYMFDKMAQLKRHAHVSDPETVAFDLEPATDAEIINREDAMIRQQKVRQALQQLTPRQREAIFLKYHEGFSYEEIAGILSMTQKATYKLIGRAIQTLRSMAVSIAMLVGAVTYG